MEKEIEVFKVQILVDVESFGIDDIIVKFNSLTMSNGLEDLTFKDRAYDIEMEKQGNSALVNIYIENDGDNLKDRMDWLLDEDYLIENVDASVKLTLTGTPFEYKLASQYGVQTTRSMKIAAKNDFETSYNYLRDFMCSGTSDEEVSKVGEIFKNMLERDVLLQKTINDISKITLI